MRPVASLFPAKPKTPLVRLMDGKTKREGRVEVFHEGQWGTVCDDDWDLKEASIVCQELGFGRALLAAKHSRFGKGICAVNQLSFFQRLQCGEIENCMNVGFCGKGKTSQNSFCMTLFTV